MTTTRIAILSALIVIISLGTAFADTIRVRVVSADGRPVDGAQVLFIAGHVPGVIQPAETMFATTKADGKAKFLNVGIGEHTLTISKAGYLTVRIEDVPVDPHIPQKIAAGEIVVTLNALRRLSPYAEPEPR